MAKTTKDPNTPRSVTVHLSLGKATALSVLAVFVVAWAFALGIVVGRGYKPEQAVPEIARIMPMPQAAPKPTPQGVLRPEELSYLDTLSKPPENTAKAAERPVKRPAPQAEKPAEKATAPAQAQPQAQSPAQQPAPPPQAAPAPAPKPAAPAPAPAQAPQPESQERFTYIYQVASFTDQAQAKALSERIRGLGLSPTTEASEINGRTWHRVLVRFIGTAEETQGMRDKLATLGLSQIIMRSKTPL